MTETGVVHGRFQIFHLDHLKYVLAARERCRHLVVGITNPDPTLTKTDAADLYRSSSEANPLTYFERYSIIRAVLLEAGLDHAEFSIVPFPINFPDLYHFYVPLDAVFYLTIYDDWGKRKLNLFQSLALKVEVLWVKPGGAKRYKRKRGEKSYGWRGGLGASRAACSRVRDQKNGDRGPTESVKNLRPITADCFMLRKNSLIIWAAIAAILSAAVATCWAAHWEGPPWGRFSVGSPAGAGEPGPARRLVVELARWVVALLTIGLISTTGPMTGV